MRRWQKNLFVTAFLISLLLHFSSGLVLYFKSKYPKKSDSVEITLVEPHKNPSVQDLKNDARQIVEQSDHRINDEIDPKAKYLSRYNQKVVTQTRAANHGKFQNDAKQGPSPKNLADNKSQPKPHEKNAAKTIDTKKSKILQNLDDGLPILADLQPQFHWEKVQVGVPNPGPQSQSDDYLKDVQTGPQTLLSSREFIYYSYYSRIKERLRLFWEPKIKEKIQRLFMAGRHIANNEERITRLVITLDNGGKLIRVQVLGESGLKDLDDAAIEAFQLAAPFPNPPKGIIEGDGTIKIRWDFILEA